MTKTLVILALIGMVFMVGNAAAVTRLKCASTTSTQNSGLYRISPAHL